MIKLFWNTHNQPKFSENNKDSTNYTWGIYHKKNSDKWIYEILKKVKYTTIENEKDLETSVNEYQKLLKLNNLIEKKFQITNKEISEDTKSKIKNIISEKNEKKIK